MLDAIQAIVLLVIGILFFQGRGAHGTFVAIALALPLLRAAASSSYRNRWRSRYQNSWSELERFSSSERGTLPLQSAFWWIGLPMLLLTLTNGSLQSSDDNRGTVLTALSLTREGTPDFSHFMGGAPEKKCSTIAHYYARCAKGAVYSSYPAGMLVFAVPVFALSRAVGVDPSGLRVLARLEKITAVLVACTCAMLFLLIAARLFEPRSAWVASIFLGFGSAIFSTVAGGLWTNGGVALCLLAFLAIEIIAPRHVALQGIAIATMLACRLTAATIFLPAGVWILARDPKRATRLATWTGLSAIPWAVYYYALYKNPLGVQMLQAAGFAREISIPQGLAAVLWSPARGLLIYQPWLLLAIPGTGWWKEPRTLRGIKAFCIAAILFQLGLIASWGDWAGGWCWGSRLMTEVIPLAALLTVPAIGRLLRCRAHRIGLGVLAAICFYLHAIHFYAGANMWMGAKPEGVTWHERYWDWSDPPFLYPFTRRDR